jgi:hypothetical protein
MKMTFQEIRIIATGPCIANQLRDVSTICRIHIVKMYKDKQVKKNVNNIFLSMCDVKIFLTFIQLRDVSTICRRSWYIAAHVWKIYDFKIEVVPCIINFSTELTMTFYLSMILDLQIFFHWYILQSWKLKRPHRQLCPHHFWTYASNLTKGHNSYPLVCHSTK